MSQTLNNNKRIAKNTLLLYFRQLLLMFIGLFTSRVVLNSLGVENYGVYNVVGGIVAMFTLLTGSLSAAISRFINVGLGKGDIGRLNVIFSTAVNVQIGMAILVGLLCEIGGVWFLNTHLNIPIARMEAANWVLQLSIITFCINLISVPYNAAIIAHEKMNVFAYISILEGVFKLIVAYTLYVSPYDKLKTYAVLLTVIAIILRFIYGFYCGKTFKECHYHYVFDKQILKDISGFAGWNFFGSGAYLFNTQGVNIVTNLFFGVAANAARGVATQAEGIVKTFVTNFTTAINPQIMKSYAEGNLHYTFSLVCRGAKFSYCLMLIFAVPFMFETETIMTLWLKTYPPEAPLFLRLSMIGTMFDLLGNSTANAAWATGKIKRYYLYVATIGCLVFPISWICFEIGCPAYTSYIVFAVIYLLLVFVKLWILNGLIGFPQMMFIKEVVFRIGIVTLSSFILPVIVYNIMNDSMLWHLLLTVICGISACYSIYLFGLSTKERKTINTMLLNKYFKIKTMLLCH
ncbi:MAG: lipopolysaccharide biosynthesis protein [Prevotellaceae bacterium]|nr:lipopolysaccharide biosynthesis protein [Prevotellaceae bacterium]